MDGISKPSLPLDASARLEQQRDFLNAMPMATVLVGAQARIEASNGRMEALVGTSGMALKGSMFTDLLAPLARDPFTEGMADLFAAPATESRPVASRTTLVRADGTELPAEMLLGRYGGEEDLCLAFIRQTSASPSSLADSLAAAVEDLDVGIALFDARAHLRFSNDAFRRATSTDVRPGDRYDGLLASWAEAIEFPSPSARDSFISARLAARATGETSSFSLTLYDGRRLQVDERGTADGGFVINLRDCPPVGDQSDAPERTRHEASSPAAARAALSAPLSHSLRTALNALLGSAQLLLREGETVLGPRQRARVERILAGGQQMTSLLDELADLPLPEMVTTRRRRGVVSLSEVVREVFRRLSPLATTQDITIEMQGMEEAPAVIADRGSLFSILANLTSNAITYNRRGGSLRLQITPGEVVRVAIIAVGVHIPSDEQGRIRRALQRPAKDTMQIGGAGLGLGIAQRLIRPMRGSVGFTSSPDSGAAFWIELPTASRPRKS